MKYLEWNNLIANHIFNPENAGKDVYLYITKPDIINIAKYKFIDEQDSVIWEDFLTKIKIGISGSKKDIIGKVLDCYRLWNRKPRLIRIDSIDLFYPPYIAYLALFVLPLTEVHDDYNANNYYGRLNKFLADNDFHEPNIGTSNFSTIDLLWQDLQHWANQAMNQDYGNFQLHKFGNPLWIYVGKPFSQCLLTPKAIKRMPEFFLEAGMIPDSFYPNSEIRKYLVQFGSSILGFRNNVVDLIEKSDTNELGQSITEIVKREYKRWTGEAHQIILAGTTERTKRNYAIAPLLLQFKTNENEGTINFSFRMYSSNEYPEDLKFEEFQNIYECKGFSKTLDLPFQESFELKDNFNKWIAKFPYKEIRLFINAGSLQLSNEYWIETDILYKTDWMYMLCKDEKKQSILEWGRHFDSGKFKEVDFDGFPNNYSLFKFLNPKESHAEFPLLTVYTEKSIQLVDGLKINFRTFFSDFLPEVEITNSDGNEFAFLKYRNSEEKHFLKKKQFDNNRWLLPEEIILNTNFYIKVDGESFSGNEIAYTIISANNSALKINGIKLPKRDSFGRRTDKELTHYALGSNTVGTSLRRQEPYRQFFASIFEDLNIDINKPNYKNHEGNILLSFLTLKNTSTTEDFYMAFEYLYLKYFGKKYSGLNFNYSKIKKAALNFYDYLGYLDYDYETKEIIVCPSQLVLIPSTKGRRVLLIGGRDFSLIDTVIEAAPRFHLKVDIVKQSSLNESLLLPDAIIIRAFGKRTDSYGERNLVAFADELKIKYMPNDLVQVGLQDLSATIDEYQQYLLSNNETNQDDYDWARRVFNYNTLTYEKDESQDFDRTFSLIEYKLNEYTYYDKLWKDGKCFVVDKNWGKFLVLKYYNKQVILYNHIKNKVAIPLELPLPRLLAESIILLSGIAPEYSVINSREYRIYTNIPSPFIKNLFNKLKQNTIDYNI